MEGLAVLAVLVVLAIPVSIIVLFVGQSGLRQRLREVELALDLQYQKFNALARGQFGQAAAAMDALLVDEPGPDANPVLQPEADVGQDSPIFDAPSQAAPLQTSPPQDTDMAAQMASVSPWDRARKGPVEREATNRVPAPQAAAPVVRPDRIGPLMAWLRLNWVYAISAASLALAGVFFVQYGMEKGLLPPWLRVVAAIVFGGALIGTGEWMRRRHGDGEDASTAYLPSVFAGAGLVSIFAAVLSARLMYGLIGPQTAFVGHLATAALAIGLGWFYGPLLAAVGLLGAAAAPFIVAGGSEAGPWLYSYFAVIAVVGLAVDTLRRWAWVSVLALVLGYGGGWLVMVAGAGLPGWTGLLLALPLLAVIIPERGLVPRQDGPCAMLAALGGGKAGVPPFPAQLAAGAALASTVALALLAGSAPAEAMLAMGVLALLALAYLLWADKAKGLADLGFVPAIGVWVSLLQQGMAQLPLAYDFTAQEIVARAPETAAPMTVTLLLAMSVALSAAFAWRSFRQGALSHAYALAAVLMAPVAAAILELTWQPAPVLGAYPWALHVIALAAGMVALAWRYATLDGEDRQRAAWATLSALSLIALAVFLITTKTALTLALAVLALVAAGLDRRFKLPEMGWFIQIAVAVLGYRLLADPGVSWAMDAPLGQVLVAFGGVIAALLAALWLLQAMDRPSPVAVLESAALGFAAILANILISRWLLPDTSDLINGLDTHWGYALNAAPWLILMLMQIYRARAGGALRWLRQGIAIVAGGLAAVAMAAAVIMANPLFYGWRDDPAGLVRGPALLDSLLLAYGIPGLILLLAAWKLPGVGRRVWLGFVSLGTGLVGLYAVLEIRRFFQGDWLGGPGVTQGELYTYTVALMLLGAALLYQAIARRSGLLRRIAMGVIGLTIAKVFLLDAAGLTGLTRVFSFLGLGLSLAGLAWLNRWAGEVSAKDS